MIFKGVKMEKTIKEELDLIGLKHATIARKFGLSQPELSTILKHESTYEKIRKFINNFSGLK